MRRTKHFPVWFKMTVSILPVIGFCGVVTAVAFGVTVSPMIFTPLAVLTGKIVAEVLGVPAFRLALLKRDANDA